MSSHVPLQNPTALAQFAKLEVVAKLIVEGYMIGQHKSPFKGTSVEFVEHRQYYPGDEIRHIDWRAYGKTGKYYIKEYEEETNLRAYLLLDCSGSLSYEESTLSKLDYARQLSAAFAYLLHSQRDAVGVITFDKKIRQRLEPATSPKGFQQLMEILEQSAAGGETELGSLLSEIVPTLKRRSLVILISDFFDDIKRLQAALQLFRRHRHEVMLFQVLAPEEVEFPFNKPTQFRNLELKNDRILVDPHRLRSIYLQQFAKFEKELQDASGKIGFDFERLLTSDPYERAVGAYLDSRVRNSSRQSKSR